MADLAEPIECAYTAIFQEWLIPQGVLGVEFRESKLWKHGTFVHTVIAVDVGSAAEQRGTLVCGCQKR